MGDRDPYQDIGGYCSCCGGKDPWCDADGYTLCCNKTVNGVGGLDEASEENRWGWKDSRGRDLVRGDTVEIVRRHHSGATERGRYVVMEFSPPELMGVAEDELDGWDWRRGMERFLRYDEMAEVHVVGHREDLPAAGPGDV